MGYTGRYECPELDGYSVGVVADRYESAGHGSPKVLVKGTAERARAAMLAHGRSEHAGADWSDVSNEAFRPNDQEPATVSTPTEGGE